MGKQTLRTATLILGSVLALTIAFSQFINPECLSSCEKETVKTEQKKDTREDKGADFISLPSFSLPSPINVQANLDAYCLFEIFAEENAHTTYVDNEVSYVDRLFHTMFRVIISPNAP
jgi:hypothetical protein